MLNLKVEDLIDPELETAFFYHRKLKYWTITHDHDFYECFLVTEGTVYHVVNGVRQTLRAGTLVFIRPHDVHSYERYENEEVELLNINFRVSMMHSAFAYLGEGIDSAGLTEAALPPSRLLGTEDMRAILRYYERIGGAYPGNKAEARAFARSMLTAILQLLVPARQDSGPDVPGWLNELLAEMRKRERFAEGTAAFYRLAPYTVEHVCREMKKHFGITPTEWINEQRLSYAALSLAHSEAGILDICMDCGFSSLSYFYKTFAKRFGSTPAQYRAKQMTAIP
ncbi:helix-turn-helix domain-containing protein [Paenibacillus spongiae]|uniref:Helix-turn-helix domain-containing protein n=1 Tax=Paenibacillus spongiae TaxID=2909671 RepID=A0ABY5S754_9BACL|nr:helix-turn-helix domain-containing protein [Paenibacillus spongiae]UVI29756.1 helix-turn-helix domain-containing protein [Paenibacillus spongiae]